MVKDLSLSIFLKQAGVKFSQGQPGSNGEVQLGVFHRDEDLRRKVIDTIGTWISALPDREPPPAKSAPKRSRTPRSVPKASSVEPQPSRTVDSTKRASASSLGPNFPRPKPTEPKPRGSVGQAFRDKLRAELRGKSRPVAEKIFEEPSSVGAATIDSAAVGEPPEDLVDDWTLQDAADDNVPETVSLDLIAQRYDDYVNGRISTCPSVDELREITQTLVPTATQSQVGTLTEVKEEPSDSMTDSSDDFLSERNEAFKMPEDMNPFGHLKKRAEALKKQRIDAIAARQEPSYLDKYARSKRYDDM